METLKLKSDKLIQIENNLTILRTFEALSFDTARDIQRSISSLQKVSKLIQEDFALWEEKFNELVTDNKNLKTTDDKYKALMISKKELEETIYEVNIHILKDTAFPKERKAFGMKKIILQDGSIREIAYIDAYLELLDVVIIEEDKFDEHIKLLRKIEKVKELILN